MTSQCYKTKRIVKRKEEISANTDPLLHFVEGYDLASFGKYWRRTIQKYIEPKNDQKEKLTVPQMQNCKTKLVLVEN